MIPIRIQYQYCIYRYRNNTVHSKSCKRGKSLLANCKIRGLTLSWRRKIKNRYWVLVSKNTGNTGTGNSKTQITTKKFIFYIKKYFLNWILPSRFRSGRPIRSTPYGNLPHMFSLLQMNTGNTLGNFMLAMKERWRKLATALSRLFRPSKKACPSTTRSNVNCLGQKSFISMV